MGFKPVHTVRWQVDQESEEEHDDDDNQDDVNDNNDDKDSNKYNNLQLPLTLQWVLNRCTLSIGRSAR